MTKIHTDWFYCDFHGNDNEPNVKLHWIDWNHPPELEIVKVRW